MKLKDIHIWTLVIGVGIIAGVIFSSMLGFSRLAYLTGLSVLIILIVFIIELFIKGNRLIRIAGFLFFFFFFASITSFATMRLMYDSQMEYSQKVISALNSFYKEQKQFPANIDSLEIDKATLQQFVKNQHYHVDTSRQSFSISFNVDGATTHTFNSAVNTWTFDDF